MLRRRGTAGRVGFAAFITVAAAIAAACTSSSIAVNGPSAAKCQVSATNQLSGNASSDGVDSTISVEANRDCTWEVTSGAAWITLTSTATGQGSGSVRYHVGANNQPLVRHGVLTVNGTELSVTQDAAPCRFNISPPNPTVSGAGDVIAEHVDVLAGCGWTAASQAGWISIASGGNGNGPGDVRLAVAPNSSATPRSGAVTIGDQTVTVTQSGTAPTPCTYTVSPTATTIAPAGGNVDISVTSPAGCAWTMTSNAPWIGVPAPASRQGSASVSLSVAANGGDTRVGTVSIAGQTVTVTQTAVPPPPCTYSINPTVQTVPSNGGVVYVSVTTGPTCAWTATANAPWLSVTVATGTGNGTATVTAAANTGGDRSGTVTIAGQTFTVNQPAAPPACTYSIAPTSQSFTSDGGTVSVTVTTGSTCTWNVMSNAPWISVQPGGQQTGPGTATVTVSPNGGGDRNGTATIAGQVFSVTQTAAPPPCTYSLSPTTQAFTSDGGAGTITVTTGSGCAWTATTDRDWITITSAVSGVGPGTVTFQVGVNTGGNRDGNIKIATENFKVTQSEPPKPTTAATAR